MFPKIKYGFSTRETYLQDPRTLIKYATIKYDDEGNQIIEDYCTHYRVAYYNAEENKTYWHDNNVEFSIGNTITTVFDIWIRRGKGPALG